ncbi:hypothetical protein ACHAW6_003444 [Cyclotella cf. meneghiniana]
MVLSPESSVPQHKQQNIMTDANPLNLNEYTPILESIMRITLAGFGGAMAGLSISRRAALSRTAPSLLTDTASTTKTASAKRKHAIHRHHPLLIRSSSGEKGGSSLSPYAIDRELPAAWAMACMTFTGVIEFTRLVSPTGAVIDLVSRVYYDGEAKEDNVLTDKNTIDSSEDDTNQDSSMLPMIPWDFSWPSGQTANSILKTIADYTIGGSIGGALFSGSAVRTRAGRRIDASILGTASRGARALSGLLPGAGLGFLAGVVIVSVDLLLELLEENFGEVGVQSDQSSDVLQTEDGVGNVKNDHNKIPAHIKAMSNEELARSIEELRSRKV